MSIIKVANNTGTSQWDITYERPPSVRAEDRTVDGTAKRSSLCQKMCKPIHACVRSVVRALVPNDGSSLCEVIGNCARFFCANGIKVVLFFLGFFLLWSIVALIGTAASFKPESPCASGTCSLLLVRPYDEEAKHILQGGGYRKHRLIETSPDGWGVDFGNGVTFGKDDIYVPSEQDLSNVVAIANRDVKFALVVVGFVLIKLLRILSLLAKVQENKQIKPSGSVGIRSWFLGNLPTHLIHLFFTYDSIEYWLGKDSAKICSIEWLRWRLLDSFMFFTDFCLLTWAPSIATIPFSSIAPEEAYINAGEVRYELDVFWYMPFGFFIGFVSYALAVYLDFRYVERERLLATGYWSQWTAPAGPSYLVWRPVPTCTKTLRIIAGLARLTIVILWICIPAVAFCLASFDFSLILGVSLKVLFKASFRFALIGWATMFRVGLVLMMIIEVSLSAYIFSKGDHYDHYRPWPSAPEKPVETPPPPSPAIPPLPASPPSRLLNRLDPPDEVVNCCVSPATMCSLVLSQEVPYNHGMLCSAMPNCSKETPGPPRPLHHPRHPDQFDQLRLQSGTAEERVINNDL